ncbi:dienelactone hydrolase family protein [Streptomyces sp. NPDC057539]|uniref:dienelactone hydrolase family protein n=1 Tax=Streptomyces sp. NPDC057539 TaxID=3346159 RepID=UPI00368139A5
MTSKAASTDAGHYLTRLTHDPEVSEGPVAVVGYCVGAWFALLATGSHPEHVAAAAGFHGGSLATDAPDSPRLLADRITAEMYFAHADQDPSMPPEQIQGLGDALTAAGVRHTCEVYQGAHHGFTQAGTSAYNAEADEQHWSKLLELLDRAF